MLLDIIQRSLSSSNLTSHGVHSVHVQLNLHKGPASATAANFTRLPRLDVDTFTNSFIVFINLNQY